MTLNLIIFCFEISVDPEQLAIEKPADEYIHCRITLPVNTW